MRIRMGQNGWRRGAFLAGLVLAAIAVIPSNSTAADRRWGFTVGYGGEGVTANVNNNGVTRSASRSEAPLILGLFYEQLLSDSLGVGLEHVRGVSLLPA